MKARLTWVSVALLFSGGALAQLALPGAPAPDAPGALDSPAPIHAKPKHKFRRGPPLPAFSLDPASALGRELRLNGRTGDLQLARGDDDSLKITKFVMLGEVISDPSKMCRIDIVSDTPIAAVSKGTPDGLPRYSADIPACPLTFDVVDGAVLVPAQTNACTFSAADCQASPSGLWGPELAELDKDPKAVTKTRAAADRSIQDSLRVMEKRDKDAAASLAREQNDFAAERDDLCQNYAGESRVGFCAARLAESRAALLENRVKQEAPGAGDNTRRKRKKKHAADE